MEAVGAGVTGLWFPTQGAWAGPGRSRRVLPDTPAQGWSSGLDLSTRSLTASWQLLTLGPGPGFGSRAPTGEWPGTPCEA